MWIIGKNTKNNWNSEFVKHCLLEYFLALIIDGTIAFKNTFYSAMFSCSYFSIELL